jgi:hypothetical protein
MDTSKREQGKEIKMIENVKKYAVVDEYDSYLEEYVFDNYASAEAAAKNGAEQSPGLGIFIVECKPVAKVFVPECPAPIITKF